jgi:hypothetical protein
MVTPLIFGFFSMNTTLPIKNLVVSGALQGEYEEIEQKQPENSRTLSQAGEGV